MDTGKAKGRPPLPDEERLSEIVKFRMTSEEKEILQKAAKKKGVSVSDYVRGVAVDMARTIVKGGTPAEVYYSAIMGAGTIEPEVVRYSDSAELYETLRNKYEGED